MPIQCEYYALEGLSQLLRNVNLVSSNLNESLEVTTIVLTMFDARTRLSVDVANEVRLHFADRVCKSVIPRTCDSPKHPRSGSRSLFSIRRHEGPLPIVNWPRR